MHSILIFEKKVLNLFDHWNQNQSRLNWEILIIMEAKKCKENKAVQFRFSIGPNGQTIVDHEKICKIPVQSLEEDSFSYKIANAKR